LGTEKPGRERIRTHIFSDYKPVYVYIYIQKQICIYWYSAGATSVNYDCESLC
jgi:hypothetical protein